MEIVLIRHGLPKIDTSKKLGASDFGKWISQYDQAGIDLSQNPTSDVIERVKSCSFIVCSNLPRSVESAHALNIETPDIINNLFRECEMPYANWNYPKLSIKSWALLFRIFQLAGYSSNTETYKDIKKRVTECTNQLTALSEKHKSVLFVGHGALLWFIHRQLKSMGWFGPKKSVRQHWEFGVYTQEKIFGNNLNV